jgi:hypothetical protein
MGARDVADRSSLEMRFVLPIGAVSIDQDSPHRPPDTTAEAKFRHRVRATSGSSASGPSRKVTFRLMRCD